MYTNEYIIIRKDKPELLNTRTIEYDSCLISNGHIADFMNKNYHMDILDEEYVYILSMNTNGNIFGILQLSHGNTKESIVSMREIALFVLLSGGEKFVVVHNHPNGRLIPSKDDYNITNRMIELSNLIDVEIEQHLIITNGGYKNIINYNEEDDNGEFMPFS